MDTQTKLANLIKNMWLDESGATAIEYGLIAAGIGLAVMAAAKGLGGNLTGLFNKIGTKLAKA